MYLSLRSEINLAMYPTRTYRAHKSNFLLTSPEMHGAVTF